jgi:hypothetical protein
VSAATSAAIQMLVMGQPRDALALIDWVSSTIPLLRLSGRPRARLNLARAAAYWSLRDLPRCLKAGLLGWVSDPVSAVSSSWLAARGIVTARCQAQTPT